MREMSLSFSSLIESLPIFGIKNVEFLPNQQSHSFLVLSEKEFKDGCKGDLARPSYAY
jgi:hypothetical protein